MTDPSIIILFGKKIGLPESFNISRKDESDDNPKTPSIDEQVMSENNQSTLKKPDKILPCPRCDSMNTKFCYFNNSNVNQPRHFCKSCQRYWTAGGTMRNMPVGAGRRKKKTPPEHCRYIMTQEGLELESTANYNIEFAANSNGVSSKVFSFGQTPSSIGATLSGKENRDDDSNKSVVERRQDNNGFHSQVHWIPGGSWTYNPWNTPIPIPIPIHGYTPIPMYPSPYWSSASWLPQPSSILGKHSTTDVELIKPSGSHDESKKQRSTIMIPKTLRIDDPDEAAKSSIWTTLGIKNEYSDRGDLFKAFESKGNEKKKIINTEPSLALQANPAAFSRSLCFQERA